MFGMCARTHTTHTTHTHIHMHTHTTHAHIPMHTHTCGNAHTYMHAYVYTYTRACTPLHSCMHMHTYIGNKDQTALAGGQGCCVCGEEAEELLQCGICLSRSYCSKACQQVFCVFFCVYARMYVCTRICVGGEGVEWVWVSGCTYIYI